MKIGITGVLLILLSVNGWSQETDMIIKSDDIEIGGTLLLPNGEIKAPLVIMSTGSGAQDRNETIMNFEIFRVIAEDLAAQGIPSFRYDDPGVGASTGTLSETTLEMLADDVNAITEYFKTESQARFSEFIHLGHSQGGIVGIKAATENENIKALVLMASSIVPLKDVINEQVRIMQTAMGKSEEDIAVVLEFQEKAYETVKADGDWDSLKVAYRALLEYEIGKLPPAAQATIKDMDAFTEAQFSRQVKPMRTPMMRSVLHYDPRTDLRELDIAILSIFGGKDMQVTVDQNHTALEEVCSRNETNCTLRIFESANHLFQQAESGMVTEYATLPKEFVDGFTAGIADWILALKLDM